MLTQVLPDAADMLYIRLLVWWPGHNNLPAAAGPFRPRVPPPPPPPPPAPRRPEFPYHPTGRDRSV